MAWPLSQDFNEAIQNPSSAFGDADLKGGKVTTTPLGVPLPRSGNYADVYQIIGADGRPWALKCFTRAVAPDLQARYAAIAGHLAQANLPFTVGFEFLPDGIRVKGKTYPALKMQWVEGSALNTFVKDNLGRASILENMLSLWVRLCRRLRETGMAHCDLQHGNVILVPGEKANSLGLKLVDYDGMFVPALAGKNPGEAGHASFQHPQRIITNDYSADLDRFPHLVVATALRGLLVGGKPLWDKYDTGDNLLFTAKDFTAPAQSKVMRELWDSGDPFTVGLLSHLVIAASKPLAQSPWLDTLMPEGRPPVLTPSQERQAMQLLGIPVQGAVPPPQAPQVPAPANAWGAPPTRPAPQQQPAPSVPDLGFDSDDSPRRRPAAKSSTAMYGAIAAGVVAFLGIGIGVFAFGGKKNSASESQAQGSSTPVPVEKPPEPVPVEVKKPPVGPVDPTPPAAGVKEGKLLWSVASSDAASSVGRTVTYTHDGAKLLVPQTNTGQIRVFDAKTGAVLATFLDHAPSPQVMAAPLPDGKVLSIGTEPVLMVWDDATGKALARVTARGPEGTVDLLQTDREGKYALIAAGTNAAVIDLDEGAEVITVPLAGAGLPGRAAAMLSADGSQMLSITPDNKLVTQPLPSGTPRATTLMEPKTAIIVAWSPEKNLAVTRIRNAAGTIAPELFIVNTLTGATLKSFPSSGGRAAFTPDGDTLVAAAQAGAVNYLNPLTGEVKAAIVAKDASDTNDIAVGPGGSSVAFLRSSDRLLSLGLKPGNTAVETTPRIAPPPVAVNTTPPTVANLAPVLTLKAPEFTGPVVSAMTDRDAKVLYYTDGSAVHSVVIATKLKGVSTRALGKVKKLWATDAGLVVEVVNAKETEELLFFDETGSQTSSVSIEDKTPVHSVAVSVSGGHAAVTRSNGDVSIYDLKEHKLLYTMHLWGKDPAPADPTVSAFWPDPAEKLFIWRSTRLQVYPVSDLNTFSFITPGGTSTGIDDVSDDGKLVAFRRPRTSSTGFFLKQTGNGRSVPGVSTPAASGEGVSFRFLGNGGRAAMVAPNRVMIVDTATGKISNILATAHPATATGATMNSGRTALTIFGGPYLSVLSTATAATEVVKTPMPMPMVPEVTARKPIPTDAALKTAETTVKEIFKELYAKRLPADRRKLAETLYKTAGETANDPAAKYYLLKEVQTIAVELADTQLGSRAIEQVDLEFDVDGTALRIALMERVASTATKVDVLRNLADTCGEMVEDLVDKNEFEKALKVAAVGVEALKHANLPLLARDLEARQVQIRKQREAFEPVKAALETLKKNPADADAQLLVGKYRCFVLGRWPEGLPNLIAGSDAALKNAATLDTSADVELTEMKRADAWWTWAQTQQDPEKSAAINRAKFWYAKIIASGKAGLDRGIAESRMGFTLAGIDYRPGVVVEIVPQVKVKGATKTVKVIPTPELAGADYKAMPGVRVYVKIYGYLVPPAGGRYKLVADGYSEAIVRMFAKPEEKKIIEILNPALTTTKRDYLATLTTKPVPVSVEAYLYTSGVGAITPNTFSLKWQKPGGKAEEAIPADLWFHSKTQEAGLTEK